MMPLFRIPARRFPMSRVLVVVLSLAVMGLVTPAGAVQEGKGKELKVLNKTAGEWLKILKTDPEVRFRRAALIALEVFGPGIPGVTAGLFDALEKDAEEQVRRETAQALGRMGPDAKGAVDALALALKSDKSDLVREAAARALGGKMASQSHTQVLVIGAALKDRHAGTRAAAAETLRDLGEKAKAALPQLLEVAKDVKADRFPRLYAIQILSRVDPEGTASLPLLIGVLADQAADVKIREAAAEALGRVGKDSEAAVKELGKAVADKQPEMRRAALVALHKIGEPARSTWPMVKNALKDANNGVRYHAIRLAGTWAKEEGEVVPALVETGLKDENVENRLAAIQELAELGPIASRSVEALTGMAANDARSSVREAAQEALKKIKANP
jgi:HEAT repeat protein